MGTRTARQMATKKLAAVGALSAAVLGFTACGTTGEETGADVEDVQEAFDLPQVEQEMAEELDEDLFADYDGQPYIEATEVSTDAPTEG